MNEKVSRNLNNHCINGNSNSNSRQAKFIGYFINNRSSFFKYNIKVVNIIQINDHDANNSNIISTKFEQKIKYNLKENVRMVKKNN